MCGVAIVSPARISCDFKCSCMRHSLPVVGIVWQLSVLMMRQLRLLSANCMWVNLRSVGNIANGVDGRTVSYSIIHCNAMSAVMIVVAGRSVLRDMAYHMAMSIMLYNRSVGNVIHIPSIVAPGSEAMVLAPVVNKRESISVAISSHKWGCCRASNSCIANANNISGVSSGVSNRLDSIPHMGM